MAVFFFQQLQTPKHLLHWFTPKPWKTVDCRIDLRPGGEFYTLMRSPGGQDFPNRGCFLEVVPEARLVWTDCLQPGFRPTGKEKLGPREIGFFTAVIELAEGPHGGTLYRARAMHRNSQDRHKHAEMGFEQCWGAALDQLVAYMKTQ